MNHILILTHRQDRFHRTAYFLSLIAKVWREDGFRVSIMSGLGSRIPADAAVLHVDLTIVPVDYLAFARQYSVAINGNVEDISKRRISRNLVRFGDDYFGPVVVKTDLNYGGKREALLGVTGTRLRRNVRALSERVRAHLRPARILDYPIYESVAHVPPAVWSDPRLIVERFLPERRGDLYCLRTWVFLGDRETNAICYSAYPIVKASNILRREIVADVPDDLRRMRQELGFDFGKFDYAIVNGRTILYDTNRTPMIGNFPRAEVLPRIGHLAQGIRSFL